MSNPETYTSGEDPDRLRSAAKFFGIQNTRTPLKPVREVTSANPNHPRLGSTSGATAPATAHSHSILKFGSTVWENVGLLFSDSTLEAARMHSVGVTAQEERVASDGTLHLMSIAKRKKTSKPTYDDLMDLFHQKPLEPLEYEIRPVDEEYVEVLVDSVEGGSIVAAIFGIIKGMVGPAVLYLPRGFALSGFAVAIPAMLVATLTYVYSATRLLQCWKAESDKSRLSMEKMEEIRSLLDPSSKTNVLQPATTYGAVEEGQGRIISNLETSNNKLLTYPELARRAFGKASFLISGGIAAMQFGVCLTYLIFVPQNLCQCAKSLFGVEISKQVFLVIMLAVEIPLCWIRDIRKLTPLNITATALIAFGLLSVLFIAFFDSERGLAIADTDYGNIFDKDLASLFQEISVLPKIQPTWVLFIGTSFFCFEGSITLILPLQEAVYKREDRKRFPYVNQKVTCSLVCMYIFFSIVCW
jgi:hypothetical protein